ncbi:MAG: preprotein translocase subunit SecG, partial [Myxococcales bacterium]|nr:preprotein translocase subunit SecG [Myxococcales bacterium]
MATLVSVLHVSICLFLVLVVLLQAGKGGGVGGGFGGAGGAVFGGSGAGNLLTRLTAISAALFMVTSLTLAWFASKKGSDSLRAYSEQQKSKKDRAEQERLKYIIDAGPEVPADGDAGTAVEGGEPVEGAAVVPAAVEGA